MIKEIKIYADKKVTVDFDKVYEYICTIFSIFLFGIYILFPDKEIGVGVASVKNIILIVTTTITFITLIGVNILKGNFKFDRYVGILGIYLSLIVLSAIYSKYPDNALFGIDGRCEGIITLACYFIIFYIFYKGFKYNEKVFNFVTIALLCVSCFGIIEALFNTTAMRYMAASNFGNPNMFSSLLTLFLPIYLIRYFLDKEDKDYYIYICSIIFAALVCTKTFGGYFTFAIYFTVLSIYFVCISKDKKEIVGKIFKILLVFFIVFLLLNMCNDFVYFEEIGVNALSVKQVSNGDIEQFGNNRIYIWKLCLKIVAKYPVFGVGPDSLGDYVIQNYLEKDEYLFGKTVIDKAHNEYLHVAVTTGIPSALVYICFLVMIVIALVLKYKKYVKNGEILEVKTMMLVAVSASIASYLIQAFGNISVFDVAPLFWAMLGIGAKISEKEY